jgi:hypothetical protein
MFDFLKKKKSTKPIDRSIAFSTIYDEIYDFVALSDIAEETYTVLYDVYYDETAERFYALAVRDGIVYKIEVFPEDNEVRIGEFIELSAQDIIPRGENKFRAFLGKNGEMRWLSIASVAVLNRVGEIDSRKLFDSFIDFANRSGNFPVLNVYHLGDGSEIGRADILARRGYVYIAGGTFNQDEFGRTAFESLKERDDWGNSIEFYSPYFNLMQVELDGDTIQVPVYEKGINTGITLVREKDAASVFTLHKVNSLRG